jgi:AAA ATPase domain
MLQGVTRLEPATISSTTDVSTTTPAQQPARPWSGPRPLVGVGSVLDQLQAELAATADGGRAVLLTGPPGAGKTRVVGELEARARRGQLLALRMVHIDGRGYGIRGRAWSQVALRLTTEHKVARSLLRSAGEWMDMVPVVGKVLHALTETVTAFRRRGGGVGSERVARALERAEAGAVPSLLQHGRTQRRLVVLDDLDHLAARDLADTATLIRRIADTRMLLVATFTSRRAGAGRDVEELALEAERLGRTRRLALPALGVEDVREAIRAATRQELPEPLVRWLTEAAGGTPAGLWNAMGGLEAAGALERHGRGWHWAGDLPPDSAASLAAAEAAADAAGPLPELAPADRSLLAAAALQGPVFDATLLARMVRQPELDVEDRLARLARGGMIRFVEETTTGDDISSRYAFDDPSHARALAGTLTPDEVALLRRGSAEAL